jgi:hypothetical protein
MKLLKVLVAVLVMAAMAVPVIAEDRLSLSGSLQVRGFLYDADFESTESFYSADQADAANYAAEAAYNKALFEYGFVTDPDVDPPTAPTPVAEGDKKSSKTDEKGAWNDQRLRIAGKLAVAEGVSVNFRLDATESDENSSDAVAWGGTSSAAYQYAQRRADIQFDKAYIQIDKFGGTLMAGQQYFGGVGHTRRMADMLGAGFVVKYEGLTLQHVKRMDGDAGKNGINKYENRDDRSMTVLSYDFKGDGFSLTPAIAYNDDQYTTNADFFGAALAGSIDLGPVAVKGEFDYFDGDTDGTSKWDKGDLKGAQVYLDGSMAATDALRIGVMGLWAAGYDKADEQQITNMNDDGTIDWTFAEWNPQTYGYWSGDMLGELDIFDPTGSSAGVQAGSIYADFKVSEDLAMKFSGLIWQVDEDKNVDADGYFLNAGFNYKLAANTALISQLNYASITYNPDVGKDIDDTLLSVLTGIVVSF